MRHYWRDLRGHFSKQSDAGALCPHKCCQGKRVHPEDEPLVPDRAVLRALTDDQMARAMARMDWSNEKRVAAFMREADRRDSEARRRARAKDKAAAIRQDHDLAVEAAYLQAEHETRGHMLSKAGYAAGIDPRDLITGTRARARKYGSEELNEWIDAHGQLSITKWRSDMARQREAAEDMDRWREDRSPYPEVYPAA